MTLGEHILILRKQKGLSQSQLAKEVGTSGDIIGRYERDATKPSIEVVIKIANTLEVSIDYLVGKTAIKIDKETMNRLEEIDKLPDDVKTQVLMVVDALIRDYIARKTYTL